MPWRIQYSKKYLDNITYEYEESWSVTDSEPGKYDADAKWFCCYSLAEAEWLLDVLTKIGTHDS